MASLQDSLGRGTSEQILPRLALPPFEPLALPPTLPAPPVEAVLVALPPTLGVAPVELALVVLLPTNVGAPPFELAPAPPVDVPVPPFEALALPTPPSADA